MKNQEKLVEKFQLEELEQRYEMGWRLKKVEVITPGGSSQDGIN